jgi:molecular chaperone HscB
MNKPISLDLQADDFALFGVPRLFVQDRDVLAQRWRALQAAVHPDRFAREGAVGQRLAMQWAVRVNEAYQRLKDPIKRAALLCQLHGVAIDAERNTAMPVEFLMQQMQWREALEDVHDATALDALQQQVLQERRRLEAQLTQLLDQEANHAAAAQQVRALMFVQRFMTELDECAERLTA